MDGQGLTDDVGDGLLGVERRVGVLEDQLHRVVVPAERWTRSEVMFLPSTMTVPSVGSMRRSTSRARVDFPEPLSPATSPKVVPALTCRLT